MQKTSQIVVACLLVLVIAVSNACAQVSHRFSDGANSVAAMIGSADFENSTYNVESLANEPHAIWPEGNESDSEDERERIETDRHDFTQSSTTVPRGFTQFEFGYTFFQKSGEVEVEDTHTTPELSIRYGLTEKVELRLRYNEVWQFAEQDRIGSEDLRIGFKVRISDQLAFRPESALEFRFAVPTGGVDFSTDEVEFGLDYTYGWKVAPRIKIYGSSDFSTNALGEFSFLPAEPTNEDFILYTQSIAIGTELTDRITAYSEFFVLFTDGFEDDEERPAFFNTGLDYYVTDDFVLDIRAGTGLNRDAEDLFFGLGGGFRF